MAARWAGYTAEAFFELEGMVQSRHVAAYRCAQQIEAVLSQAQARENRRQARAANPSKR